MTMRFVGVRLGLAALAGTLAVAAAAQPPTLVDPVLPVAASVPAQASGLPPLFIPPPVLSPPPVVNAAPPATPMPPAMALPVLTEVAKPIPPEPIRPAEAPRVTGPATTVRPAGFETASVSEVRAGAKFVDGPTAYAAMLADAKAALAKVNDYSGHMIRQERVKGKLLPEQTAEMYGRTKPASLALRVIAPALQAGKEYVGVAGAHAGKVRATVGSSLLWLEVTDPRFAAENRHSPAEIGISGIVETLEKQLATERRLRNSVSILVGDYEFAGRSVKRFEILTERPHALRYAARTVVYVDAETKLPVRFEAYDGPAGERVECYSFVNVKLNPGVPESAFSR